ncbi:MAG: helix-turn-helix domain-containing protein [Candidatus Dormibacteria bacterium]
MRSAEVGFKRAYSLREAADVLNISVPFAYRLARRQELPGGFRLGGRWLFGKDAVDFLALHGRTEDDWAGEVRPGPR